MKIIGIEEHFLSPAVRASWAPGRCFKIIFWSDRGKASNSRCEAARFSRSLRACCPRWRIWSRRVCSIRCGRRATFAFPVLKMSAQLCSLACAGPTAPVRGHTVPPSRPCPPSRQSRARDTGRSTRRTAAGHPDEQPLALFSHLGHRNLDHRSRRIHRRHQSLPAFRHAR